VSADCVAFALDVPSLDDAARLAGLVGPSVGVLKIGLEMFTRHGPEAVARLRSNERKIFLDLKLHDIPETVERAVRSASDLGVDFLTVHASGGAEMLRRASRAAGAMRILAVTVLTSLDDADLASIGVATSSDDQVRRLASLAWAAGVRGFVTSPAEVAALRSELPDAYLVTPGVRASGAVRGDQKRTSSAREAIARGADLVVVGRPIRDAADPAAAARDIAADVAAGLADRAARA
jgi:orotidine-5'-phosphate decarboxylase